MKYIPLLLITFFLAACQLTDATQDDDMPPETNNPGLNPSAGLLLINNTSEALYYILISPQSAQPLRQFVDISLDPEPRELVAAGETNELESFDCAAIEQLLDFQLLLYRVEPTDEAAKARGTLMAQTNLTDAVLKQIQQDDNCEIRLGTYAGS